MLARNGSGGIRDIPSSSERSGGRAAGGATCGDARRLNNHGTVFIGATDLEIMSAALAHFIVDVGRRFKDAPERAEVIRAREIMDRVDDELYALSHTK